MTGANPGSNVEMLVRGGPTPSVNGLCWGPDGRLYAGSVAVGQILVLDVERGGIVERLGVEIGVKSPDDLAFGRDGSMYWVNLLHGEVWRRYPDGRTKQIAADLSDPDGIAISKDDRLVVCECFTGNRALEIDVDGAKPPRLITATIGMNAAFNASNFGPDGKLYGPRYFEGSVAALDIDAGTWTNVATGITLPTAVKFDFQGNLLALDSLGKLYQIDRATGAKTVIAQSKHYYCDNFAITPDRRIFISSFADGTVEAFTPDGRERLLIEGGLGLPGMLTLCRFGSVKALAVPDIFNLRLFEAESGRQLSQVKDPYGLTGPIGPVTAAASHGDHLLLASLLAGSVQIWDQHENRKLALFKQFSMPSAVVSLGQEFVVAEFVSGKVLRVTPDLAGQTPSAPDTAYDTTALAAGLAAPAGLAFDRGRLFVSEFGGGRVIQLTEAGTPLTQPRVVAEGLKGPQGLALAGDQLYVVEHNTGRLLRIDLQSRATGIVAEGLELGAPANPEFIRTLIPRGVVVSGRNAWVSGDRGDAGTVIYRITL